MNWLRACYRQYLARYTVMRRLKPIAVKVWNSVCRLWFKRGELRMLMLPEAKAYRLASLDDYAASRGIVSYPIFGVERIEVRRPRVITRGRGDVIEPTYPVQVIPATRALVLEDAIVIGRSELVIVEGWTLHHRLFEPATDYTSEEMHGRALINPRNARIVWYQHTRPTWAVPTAATLLGSCTVNYAHWVSEMLPRISALDSVAELREVPLLVDKDLPASILESIRAMNVNDRDLIMVQAEEPVFVKKLVLVEPSGYVPFEPRNKQGPIKRQGMFGSQGMRAMIDTLQTRIGNGRERGWVDIFLRRRSGYRRLLNQPEIEALLAQRGFISVVPEKLSFAEQFRLFSRARTIVGATGAGFANLLFAPPDARIVIMASGVEGAPYFYWQAMARAVGNEVSYVLGRTYATEATSVHSDYCVDPADVFAALEACGAERGA